MPAQPTQTRRRLSRGGALRSIGEAASAAGWLQHNTAYGGRTAAGYADGFPDVVLIRGGRIVFVTLTRGPAAEITAPAGEWIDALNRQPLYVEAHTVDPTRFHLGVLLDQEEATTE